MKGWGGEPGCLGGGGGPHYQDFFSGGGGDRIPSRVSFHRGFCSLFLSVEYKSRPYVPLMLLVVLRN
jgi:hypothetical protein